MGGSIMSSIFVISFPHSGILNLLEYAEQLRITNSAFRLFYYFCGLMNLNDELPDC